MTEFSRKLNQVFAGKVVRKDLRKKFPENYNFNDTSITLYSGPDGHSKYYIDKIKGINTDQFCNKFFKAACNNCFRLHCVNYFNYELTGCYYTGDYYMNKRYDEFNNYYANFADFVGVIQLQHYGSDNNFNIDFINKYFNQFYIISVGKNNYGHPGTKTLNSILHTNRKLFIVNEDRSSKVEFIIKLK